MTEQLTTGLLWTLAVLGLWNCINLAARIRYGQTDWRYAWSVIIGLWASSILWLR